MQIKISKWIKGNKATLNIVDKKQKEWDILLIHIISLKLKFLFNRQKEVYQHYRKYNKDKYIR